MKYKTILTPYEIRFAVYVGVERNYQVIINNLGKRNYVGNTDWQPWDCDIESSGAEMAVAKYLQTYWNGSFNTFKKSDISYNLQVRHSKKNDAHLIVRPVDSSDDIYILATGKIPEYIVCGWMYGFEAKTEKYKKTFEEKTWKFNGPPAYFVPQNDLKDMKEIKEFKILEPIQ
jgi:hypothetical protein